MPGDGGAGAGVLGPAWGGFKQIDEAGGLVRKGEKGSPVPADPLDLPRAPVNRAARIDPMDALRVE